MHVTIGMSGIWIQGPNLLHIGVRLTIAPTPQGHRFPSPATKTTESYYYII